jgi:hypothetical protein
VIPHTFLKQNLRFCRSEYLSPQLQALLTAEQREVPMLDEEVRGKTILFRAILNLILEKSRGKRCFQRRRFVQDEFEIDPVYHAEKQREDGLVSWGTRDELLLKGGGVSGPHRTAAL